MRKGILVLIMLISGLVGYSQMGMSYYDKFEGWIGLGVSSYSGEIGSKVTTVNPSFDVGLRYFLSERFAINGHLMYAGLTGDDKLIEKTSTRGYSFSSQLGEFAANFEFYLFKEGSKFQRYSSYKGTGSKKINFFVSVGAGAIIFSPQAFSNGEYEKLSSESYDKSSYILPYGGGIRYTFSKDWAASLVFKNYITITDYLDDYSTDSQNDAYMVGMFNIVYKLNNSGR